MAYEDTYILAADPEFLRRVAAAAADLSSTIYAEPTNTPQYVVRRNLLFHAGPRMADYQEFAKQVALVLLATNPTLSKGSTDTQIRTALAGVWTAYALVLAGKGVIASA